jgi:hypothetical protein
MLFPPFITSVGTLTALAVSCGIAPSLRTAWSYARVKSILLMDSHSPDRFMRWTPSGGVSLTAELKSNNASEGRP